jgi:ubiquinone/menaquinone biosynthesis C-methylase UbiE
MRQHDSDLVRREYAGHQRLAERASVYEGSAARGRDAKVVIADLALAGRPGQVLEVGCGDGSFAERLRDSGDGIVVVASDQSAHMAGLAAARGLPSVQADVIALPFADGSFDLVIANWMLYHVADIPAALSQIRRLLRPGGRLLATTKSADHLREVWDLVGHPGFAELSFRADNGRAILSPYFASIQEEWVTGTVEFTDQAAIRRYIEAAMIWCDAANRLTKVSGPVHARREVVIFQCLV